MSFFGFDQKDELEAEKRRFLEGGLAKAQQDDVAVYTWGEDSYDGLGEALQERGDELNDETFGDVGAVGKDFDFSQKALPLTDHPTPSQAAKSGSLSKAPDTQPPQPSAPTRPGHSLESIWDDKSPFSVLPRTGGSRGAEHHQPAPSPPTFSPFTSQVPGTRTPVQQQPVTLSLGSHQTHGVRTLEEIEAEMREAFATQQNLNQSPLLSQHQLRAAAPRQAHIQHAATPPPRMHPHSQSPRFHQQQQQYQIQLLQQQQQQRRMELQDQLRERQLLELQEQIRLEDLVRQEQQLRLQQRQQQQLAQLGQGHYIQQQHHRQPSAGRLTPLSDMQQRRHGHHSPAPPGRMQQPLYDAGVQQGVQYLPQEIQLQQRLLAEMAQAEFLNSMQGNGQLGQQLERDMAFEHEAQEVLQAEAMRKIMEAERMEGKRRRKLEKIQYMSRYNDLMTQSDKDFITRIQVSQLVTQDPYADDFYAQVYGAVMRSRMGLNVPDAVLKFGSGGGVGLGLAQAKGGRRPSAMQRMEQQVERIVNNARMREKEKITLNSLQGALGKTAGRSYKAAPRQLLQVDSGAETSPTITHAHISKADAKFTPPADASEGAAKEAARIGKEALGSYFDTNGLARKEPLTHRESLIMLERIFDYMIELDQLKREEPGEDEDPDEELDEKIADVIDKMWNALQVLAPLEISVPHPFISLITPLKGKRMLPRVAKFLDTQRSLTLFTLLVACFSQLDVVRDSPLLDVLDDSRARREVDTQTQAFLGSVMQSILPVAAKAGLRLISGLLGLFLERNDIGIVARTPPGIALLTLFISRVEVIKQEMATATEIADLPSPEETDQWQIMLDHLFQLLIPHFLFLFPSVRQATVSGISVNEVPNSDQQDQPVWQFLAALALHASVEQQQILVTSLRERVLENVATANKGWVVDEEQRRLRLSNVNIFLHALGLDSSQIAL